MLREVTSVTVDLVAYFATDRRNHLSLSNILTCSSFTRLCTYIVQALPVTLHLSATYLPAALPHTAPAVNPLPPG